MKRYLLCSTATTGSNEVTGISCIHKPPLWLLYENLTYK